MLWLMDVCASVCLCVDDNGMLDFKEFVDRFWELGKHRHTITYTI